MTHAHAPSTASWLQLHRAAVAMALAVLIILSTWGVTTALRDTAAVSTGTPLVTAAEQATRAYVQSVGLVTPAERAVRAYQHSR